MRAVRGDIVHGVSLWRELAPSGAIFPYFSSGRSEREGANLSEVFEATSRARGTCALASREAVASTSSPEPEGDGE